MNGALHPATIIKGMLHFIITLLFFTLMFVSDITQQQQQQKVQQQEQFLWARNFYDISAPLTAHYRHHSC